MSWTKKHINIKRLSVLTGIIMALAILTTQSFAYYFQDTSSSIEINDERQDNKDQQYQYLSHDAIATPTVQLNVDKPFQVVFELFQSEHDNTEAEPASIPLNFTFLKRLFNLTISKNAP